MVITLWKNLPKAVMLSAVLLLTLTLSSPAFGQATSITSTGYRATEGGGGAISVGYTTGNLGNTWAEGEWVPYQLIINNVQTDYPGLVGFPDIVMEYDFTAQNDARFVDMVRSIQAGTVQLTNAQGWPQDDGSAYPMVTRSNIEDAQNDVGNADPLENEWPGFTLLNLPNSQVNRAAPPGFGDGTPSDQFRYFYITLQDLLDAGIPTDANTIIVYYQLHESRSFVWFNSLQEQYDAYPTDDWGGYLYSLPAFAADSRQGSGYVPGSSGQLRVSFASGDKTVPIPIPERLPGAVSGLKWRDQNGNGMIDEGEQMLDGWRIYVSGTLENIFFETSTLTAGGGLYSFPNLTSNVVWNVYEDAGYEMTGEDNYQQTYPMVGTVVGVGTGVSHVNSEFGPYAWDVALTEEVSSQGDMNFGNKQCEVAIFCPPNINIDCNDPEDPSFTGMPTVESNCDPYLTDYSDSVTPGDCDVDGYLYQIERMWVVTDNIGQADTCYQLIIVTDSTPPVISGVGDDMTIECDQPMVFSDPTASDDCDDNPDLTYNDVTTPGSCPQEYSVTRTWTAVDECGNTAMASQTINVVDTTDPVISGVGDDMTIECDQDPVFSDPSVSDNCDPDPSLTYEDVTTPGSCPQEYSITRTWTATDACGNSAMASQTINVVDTTDPVISGVGDDMTIECDQDPVFSDPSASDNCDPNPSLTYEDVTTPGNCPQAYSITRTWTATDACGNSSQDSQTIYVVDTTDPVISGVGDDETIECPADPVFSDPSVSDNCDPNPSLTYEDEMTPGNCPQEYSVTRTWTATDACGNTSMASQTITVEDNTPPVITCPADIDVNCDESVDYGEATAVDACDPEPVLSYVDVTVSEICPLQVERTWTATDACGNSASCTQIIIIRDETPPVISGVGDDMTIECDQPMVFSDPTASDNCDDNPELTYEDVRTPGSCPQEYSVTRTWTATDHCDNTSQASQTIHVVDTTAPVISGVGDDYTIECDQPLVFSDPSASDNCDPDPSLTYEDVTTPGNCPQAYSVTRTWTATDACGNSVMASQTIYVVDTTAPVISGVGDDETIECPADPVFSDPSVSDNCDPNPSLTYEDETTPGNCPQEYSITRTWTAMDACGNTSMASQTITVEDNTPPVITCPADVDINCDESVDYGEASAVDACDPEPVIGYTDVVVSGSCPYEIHRTWTATDACGNSSSCTQVIIVRDETPPVISGVADDLTLDCTDPVVFSEPSVFDNCDTEPVFAYEDFMTPGNCPQEYTILRVWTATDLCGNVAVDSQLITVVDDTPPVITGVGNDTTISCDASPVFSNPTVSDECDPDPGMTHADDTTMGDCPYNYSITRTWTALDACGNSATASQTINVEDSEAPVLTCAPDETIACEDELIFTPPTVDDNCDPDPIVEEVSFDSTAGPGVGEWTYVKCWVATDTCGNASDECCQTIIREACPEEGCTFTIGGWGTECPAPQVDDMYSTQPGCVRDHYFDYVFPGGEVVIGDASGYTARWTSSWAIENYLPTGGTPAVLTGDLVDPPAGQGNVLISQILGLTLNREYSCAGVFYDLGITTDMTCYGDRIIDVCGNGKFNGMTVDEFLALANLVVSGDISGLDYYGAKVSDVNYTATCLNELYDNCDPYSDYIMSFNVTEDDNGDSQDPTLPTEYDLFQNSPNPFNPATNIKFSLPEASHVRLHVYNILGQMVADLVDGYFEAGIHTVTWDSQNAASGIYLYRLEVDNRIFTKKMLLMK